MKKLITPFALGTVVALGLFACLGGDGGGGSGNGGTIQIVGLDTASRTLITRFVTHRCEGTTVVTDTAVDTSNYAISGGYLYVWGANGDCGADVYSGSSSTIIGTWTLTPPAQPVPAANRPAYCGPTVPIIDDGLNALLANAPNLQVSITVASNSVALSISGEVCLAQQGAAMIMQLNNNVTATSTSCTSVALHNENTNKDARVTSSTAGGTVTVVFQHGNNTCTGYQYLSLPGGAVPNCTLPALDGAMMTCIATSGFFTP